MCSTVPRILREVMKLRHKLPLLNTECGELRYIVLKLCTLFVQEGTDRSDIGLYVFMR